MDDELVGEQLPAAFGSRAAGASLPPTGDHGAGVRIFDSCVRISGWSFATKACQAGLGGQRGAALGAVLEAVVGPQVHDLVQVADVVRR